MRKKKCEFCRATLPDHETICILYVYEVSDERKEVSDVSLGD